MTWRYAHRNLDEPYMMDGSPIMLVAARDHWRFPFAVLLGQRGWFDRFPTTIDATHTTVHLVDR
jgi:hypothetical protein